MKGLYQLCLWVFALLCLNQSLAQETKINIRAKAKDAKFIGSSIGGARVIVRDAVSNKILDEGVISGSTGNTDLIMKQNHSRNQQLTDEKTALFTANLDISEPTFVTVEAFAPINKKQAMVKSSTQLWVIPGKDITGDGVVLDFPGFVIDILSPQTHERIKENSEIEIKANIVMMCGCPITKGGIWDADQYEVKALLTAADGKTQEVILSQKDKESTFSGEVNLSEGLYEVLVYAFDPQTGNTGVDKVNIIVN